MNTLEKVKAFLEPGDVINDTGGECIWYKPWTCIAKWGIQGYQKRLFGKDSDYRPTHTVLYFAPDQIFSATTPTVRWETLEQVVEKGFTVYRYNRSEYVDSHVEIMLNAASQFIGRPYDYGDLMDFMICELLGYTHVRKVRLFEFSRKYMVCSTSVRAVQEKLRKNLEADDDFTFPRLFNKLNPEKWTEKEMQAFERTDVEMTTPAHYSNSAWFEGEFTRVCGSGDFE